MIRSEIRAFLRPGKSPPNTRKPRCLPTVQIVLFHQPIMRVVCEKSPPEAKVDFSSWLQRGSQTGTVHAMANPGSKSSNPTALLYVATDGNNSFEPTAAAVHSAQACAQRFLNAVQASHYLGDLNPRTITRWAREGYLPAYPVGEGRRRQWRFLKADLDAWMLSHRTGPLADLPGARDTLNNSHRCSDQRRFK